MRLPNNAADDFIQQGLDDGNVRLKQVSQGAPLIPYDTVRRAMEQFESQPCPEEAAETLSSQKVTMTQEELRQMLVHAVAQAREQAAEDAAHARRQEVIEELKTRLGGDAKLEQEQDLHGDAATVAATPHSNTTAPHTSNAEQTGVQASLTGPGAKAPPSSSVAVEPTPQGLHRPIAGGDLFLPLVDSSTNGSAVSRANPNSSVSAKPCSEAAAGPSSLLPAADLPPIDVLSTSEVVSSPIIRAGLSRDAEGMVIQEPSPESASDAVPSQPSGGGPGSPPWCSGRGFKNPYIRGARAARAESVTCVIRSKIHIEPVLDDLVPRA
eukprot:SAG11_NODE_2669_length_3107_cov_10.982747_2_plen_324_part_00